MMCTVLGAHDIAGQRQMRRRRGEVAGLGSVAAWVASEAAAAADIFLLPWG